MLDFSCEHQVLLSLKNNEKIFMNVVCCSRASRVNAGLLVLAYLQSGTPPEM